MQAKYKNGDQFKTFDDFKDEDLDYRLRNKVLETLSENLVLKGIIDNLAGTNFVYKKQSFLTLLDQLAFQTGT